MVCSKDSQIDLAKDKPNLKRFFSHRARELATISQHIFSTKPKRMIAFPCEHWDVCCGYLWGRGAMGEMKKLGWDIVLAPPRLELIQRQRLCKVLKPDAIFFIKARTWKNHPRHYPGIPMIFLMDDADFVDPVEHDHVVECTKAAALVIAGNEYVANWSRQHNPSVEKIWVPHPPRTSPLKTKNKNRPNIIMWAPGYPAGYQLESDFIAEVICKLQSKRADFEFWMTGARNKKWADGFAKPLVDAGVNFTQFGYIPQYSDYLDTLAQTPIGLHPVKLEHEYARGKSFGKLLSYMVSGTTIITDTVPDHTDFFTHQSNAMLADSADDYVNAICHLLDHPTERAKMAEQAYADFLVHLAAPVAGKKLDAAIRKAIQ